MYEMKPEYFTGIESIDQEHSRLFELAQETQDLLTDPLVYDKTEKLNSLISELIDYTKTHFAHEEAFMRSIHYAEIDSHMVLHRKFEDNLMQFDPDCLEDVDNQNEIVEKLLGFLITWLIDHIQRMDMQYIKSIK
ncbi:bacteriohemerythrin [Acetatifactor aquisgranensis]|uniref:bacteriohemerythrin n=1 Tax=Acetatifactor aquisgranensis TaxID=2941233 RepID=UPI00203A7605|nr:hemerythrin family protein [Acetatifactor aquisgranensis]MCI8542824.1 hemerythrin family protein [Lachnospiraceae bacterium]